MKQYSKKALTGLILGVFTFFSISSVFADDNNDTSDPISAIATKSAPSNNSNIDNNYDSDNNSNRNSQSDNGITNNRKVAVTILLLQSIQQWELLINGVATRLTLEWIVVVLYAMCSKNL